MALTTAPKIATHTEAGYRFALHADGMLVVTSDRNGEYVDDVCATMGEVHADDIGTYADMWLEELRCLMADAAAEFGW